MSRTTRQPLLRNRIVSITWTDAWQGGHDEYTLDRAREDFGPFMQTSVGFVMVEDDSGIMIGGCLDADEVYHRVVFIPRGMIKSVKVLRG